MSVAAGTIAARAELPLARVVAASFLEHHPGIPFFVLLADELDGEFEPEGEAFHVLRLPELGIPNLRALCFRYGRQPLSYALTPYLLGHLLDRGYDRAVFIKQESLVTGDLGPVFDTLSDSSIALTPHLLAPPNGDAIARELNILLSGVFNIGLVGVSAGDTSRRFLAWWQDRVATHCRHAVQAGMHFEQRWLDLVLGYFDGVCILRDPGYNVAHWNLPDRRIELGDGGVFVDGEPCRLFRFSGYDVDRPETVTRYTQRVRMEDIGHASRLFDRYRVALEDAGWERCRTWPYAFDTFDNGVLIPEVARALYDTAGGAERFPDPFSIDRDGYYAWLGAPARGRRSPSRLWYLVHGLRDDLQAAFPDPLGRDRRAFRAWARSAGRQQYGLPDALAG